nr:hypothetical protein [Tanacetum cinerariifolium]
LTSTSTTTSTTTTSSDVLHTSGAMATWVLEWRFRCHLSDQTNANEFTIHGLWPQPNGAPSTETFDANKIATLTSELNKNWLNLESKKQSIKLAAEKITPSIFKTYRLTDIQAAVKKINGGLSGTIICVKRKGSSNKEQIQEIRFRYTNNFRKQNNLSPSNCGPEILFSLTEVVSMPEVHHPL